MVNPKIGKPRSPGPWVDEEKCTCGERYSGFRCGVTFTEARDTLKSLCLAKVGHDGYKSRRVVLTMLRNIKLTMWYQHHGYCVIGGEA